MPAKNPDALLGKRLKLWLSLFSQRSDIEVLEASVGEPAKFPTKGLPQGMCSIWKVMNGATLSWRLPDGPENTVRIPAIAPNVDDPYGRGPHNGLFFGKYADQVTQWLTIDEPRSELKAYWIGMDDKKPSTVMFTDANYGHSALLNKVPVYFTNGAKRAFSTNWLANDAACKRTVAALEAQSLDLKKKTERRQALVALGASSDEAEDLIDWLGASVRLLLPS